MTSNPSRTFPDLQQIIDNNTDADTGVCPLAPLVPQVPQATVECYSEFLPTAAYVGLNQGAQQNATPPRLDFRLTARDLLGGVNNGNVVLTLAAGTGPFLVTSPNTAVSWDSGSTQAVTWDVAGTDANGINTANVKISLSTDGGHTYPTVLNASTPNDGSENVTIPNTNSTTARIKIEAVGNIFFDISNADFTIAKAGSSVALSSSQNPSVHGQGVTSRPRSRAQAARRRAPSSSLLTASTSARPSPSTARAWLRQRPSPTSARPRTTSPPPIQATVASTGRVRAHRLSKRSTRPIRQRRSPAARAAPLSTARA